MKEIRVVLIEDNESDFELIKKVIENGYNNATIEHFTSAKSFVSDCNLSHADIIVSDHQLEDDTSFEVIKYLNDEEADIPIIILTGDITNDEIARLITECNVDDIILKKDIHRLNQTILKEVKNKAALINLQRESQDLRILSLVAKHTNSGVMVTDVNERIIWVNEAFSSLSSYSYEDSVGNYPSKLMQGDNTDLETRKRLRKCINAKKPCSAEMLNYKKDGSEYWIKLDISPIFEDGEHTGFVATQEDITDKKNAELLLSANEELFRSLTENLSGVVLRYTMGDEFPGTIEYISERCEDIFGLSQKEILEDNNKLMALIDENDLEELAISVEESARNLTPWSFQYRLTTPQGNHKWLRATGTPSKDEKTNLVTWSTVIFEVTKEIESEKHLIRSEELFRSLTENLPGVVLRYSMGDDNPGTIEYISERCFEIFEETQRDILEDNMKLWNLIDPQDVERMIPTIIESAENLTLWNFQYKMTTPSGKRKWIRTSGKPRSKKENNQVIWDTIAVDVTKEVEYESALVESNERLNNAQKAGKIGDWHFDLATQIITWSDETFDIYDRDVSKGPFSYEELIFKHTIEQSDKLHESIQLAISDGIPYELPIQVISDKERIKDVMAVGIPVKDEAGNVIALFGTAQDITTRMEAQRDRKEVEERLESAIKGADLGVWDMNFSTGVNVVNDRWFEMIGYEPGEIEANFDTLLQLIHPEDLPIIGEGFKIIEQGIDELDFKIRLRHKDSSYRVIRDQGRVIQRDENGVALRAIGTHLDITSEVESKERLDSAIHGADLAVWDLDFESGKNTVNSRWYTMLGKEVGALETNFDEFLAVLHPEDHAIINDTTDKLNNGNDEFDIVIRKKHLNGSYLVIRNRGRVIERNVEGKVKRLIGTDLDITKEVESKTALQAAITRLENAQEAGMIGDWHFDFRTGKSTWSDEMYRLYDRDQVDGIPDYDELIFELIVENSEIVHEKIQNAFNNGEKYEVLFRIKTYKGVLKDISAIGVPEKDESGTVIGLSGTTQDVTSQIDALRKIKDSEDRLDAAIRGADLAVWDLDLETGINTVNTRWYHIMGFEPGEIETDSNTFMSRVHPEDRSIIETEFIRLNSGEDDFEIILRLLHKEGHYVYVKDQGRVVKRDEEGIAKRIIGTNLDITTETLLKEELSSSLHDKIILLQEIHHRVKNNLAVIIGLLHLQSHNANNEDVSLFYDEMSNRIKSIADVHELLYSSETLSKINLKTYIDKLFNNVLSVSKSTYPPTPLVFIDQHFEMNINQAIPLGLLVNELVTNSVKHAFEGVENPTISFSVLEEDNAVKIVYKDNGVGFKIDGHSSPNSLGFTLINTLLAQLESDYSFTNSVGFGIEFSFPLLEQGSHSYL